MISRHINLKQINIQSTALLVSTSCRESHHSHFFFSLDILNLLHTQHCLCSVQFGTIEWERKTWNHLQITHLHAGSVTTLSLGIPLPPVVSPWTGSNRQYQSLRIIEISSSEAAGGPGRRRPSAGWRLYRPHHHHHHFSRHLWIPHIDLRLKGWQNASLGWMSRPENQNCACYMSFGLYLCC